MRQSLGLLLEVRFCLERNLGGSVIGSIPIHLERQNLGKLLIVRLCLDKNLGGSVIGCPGINLGGSVIRGLRVNLGGSVTSSNSIHLTKKTDRQIYIWSDGTTYTYR